MKRIIFWILYAFIVVCSAEDTTVHECGDHEEYSECGSSCPARCTPRDPNLACTANCVPGCFCKEGYVLNDHDVCITVEECHKQEEKVCEESENCMGVFVPSCKCPHETPDCIPPPNTADLGYCRNKEHDTKMCHEEKAVVGPCRASISRFTFDPTRKTCDQFTYGGCNGTNNNFETKDMCETTCLHVVEQEHDKHEECEEHQSYETCRTACPVRCATLHSNLLCTLNCANGCFCEEGYAHTDDGKCIPVEKCPPHEEKICGEMENCMNMIEPPCICPEETPDCISTPQVADLGYCGIKAKPSLTEDTSIHECGDHEEYSECGSSCPARCTPRDPTLPCTANCVPGCVCKQGYVLNDHDACVTVEECPTHEEKTCGEMENCMMMVGPSCNCPEEQPDCISPPQMADLGYCRSKEHDTEICHEEPEVVGPCRASMPRFSYNPSTKTCSEFMYGGCNGTRNNFETNDECEVTCLHVDNHRECGENELHQECGSACPSTCETHDQNVPCTLQCVVGCFCKEGYVLDDHKVCIPVEDCPAHESLKVCDEGGACLGIGGPMCNCPEETPDCVSPPITADMGFCRSKQHDTKICYEKIEVGPCRASHPRFGYDSAAKKCITFNYGGCNGTENNFETEAECEAACAQIDEEICYLPLQPGNCFAAMKKFGFNTKTQKCEEFIWGGCEQGSNKNRFETMEECESHCSHLQTPDAAAHAQASTDESKESKEEDDNHEKKDKENEHGSGCSIKPGFVALIMVVLTIFKICI